MGEYAVPSNAAAVSRAARGPLANHRPIPCVRLLGLRNTLTEDLTRSKHQITRLLSARGHVFRASNNWSQRFWAVADAVGGAPGRWCRGPVRCCPVDLQTGEAKGHPCCTKNQTACSTNAYTGLMWALRDNNYW